jgi:hypothetical protein
MAFDQATIEWIRRLDRVPTDTQLTQLLLLRRSTNEPSEIRLLDLVLAPAQRRRDLARSRESLERRLSHVEAYLATDDRDACARRVERESRALAAAYVREHGLRDRAAAERADAVTTKAIRDERSRMAAERQDLRLRIAAITNEELELTN